MRAQNVDFAINFQKMGFVAPNCSLLDDLFDTKKPFGQFSESSKIGGRRWVAPWPWHDDTNVRNSVRRRR